MSKNRIVYAGILTFAFLFFALNTRHPAFIGLLFATILPIVSFVVMKISTLSIKLQLNSESPDIPDFDEMSDAQSSSDTVTSVYIQNESFFPIPYMKLTVLAQNSLTGDSFTKTVNVCVQRFSSMTVNIPISTQYCGLINTSIVKAEHYDCFGLFASRCKLNEFVCKCSYAIYPTVYGVGDKLRDSLFANKSSYSVENKLGSEPPDIFGYREYVDGDNMKNISSKLTAKFDTMYMREFSDSKSVCPLIIVSFAKLTPAVLKDAAMKIFASFGVRYGNMRSGCDMVFVYDGILRLNSSAHVNSTYDVMEQVDRAFVAIDDNGSEVFLNDVCEELSPSGILLITDNVGENLYNTVERTKAPLRVYKTVLASPDDEALLVRTLSTSEQYLYSKDALRFISPDEIEDKLLTSTE